jgi:hypothetical protein
MRIHQLYEMPTYTNPYDPDPNNPVVKHGKANAMDLKGRKQQARAQLKELVELAETDDNAVWHHITKLALGGGLTMGLVQNLEQVQHGIEELSKQYSRGGNKSRGLNPNLKGLK